ncbi:unnamed protein product [Sphagnum balticum]
MWALELRQHHERILEHSRRSGLKVMKLLEREYIRSEQRDHERWVAHARRETRRRSPYRDHRRRRCLTPLSTENENNERNRVVDGDAQRVENMRLQHRRLLEPFRHHPCIITIRSNYEAKQLERGQKYQADIDRLQYRAGRKVCRQNTRDDAFRLQVQQDTEERIAAELIISEQELEARRAVEAQLARELPQNTILDAVEIEPIVVEELGPDANDMERHMLGIAGRIKAKIEVHGNLNLTEAELLVLDFGKCIQHRIDTGSFSYVDISFHHCDQPQLPDLADLNLDTLVEVASEQLENAVSPDYSPTSPDPGSFYEIG